jgi:DNA-binding transcriptional LysR family regulator
LVDGKPQLDSARPEEKVDFCDVFHNQTEWQAMDLRALQQFLAVAEQGSLSGTAKLLNISQPALTKRIRRLEAQIGAPLLERLPRGVALTVYGRSLARHARLIGAQLRQADAELEALRGGNRGQIRIGAGPSWLGDLLPRAITRLLEDRPEVQVQVTEGFDDSLRQGLLEGDLDLAVVALADGPPEPGLSATPLVWDELRVVARAGHPLRARRNATLEHLLAYPWTLTGVHTLARQRLGELFRAQGLRPPEPTVETDSIEFKFAVIRTSDHLSFHAAEHLLQPIAEGITTVDVPHSSWRRAAGLITRSAGELGPAAQALIRNIEAVCAAAEIEGSGGLPLAHALT